MSIPLLELAATTLDDLLEDVVFVGGATIALWITDPGAPPVRPTKDVDVIVEVDSRLALMSFDERLRTHGFRENIDDGVIGRWNHDSGLLLDAIPADAALLGFENHWQRASLPYAASRVLPSGASIRAVPPAHLLATKLEAFAARGARDIFASRDMHDIIALIDGRAELPSEIANAPDDLRRYVAASLASLKGHPRFDDAMLGALGASPDSERRGADIVIPRINAMIRDPSRSSPSSPEQASLFPAHARSDASPSRHTESTWAFLNRVDDPAFDRVRRLLNGWLARYPQAKRHALRRRMERGREDQFHSAWFELYLHELHLRLGLDVVVEPTAPGVTRLPEFMLRKGTDEYLLEATIVGGVKSGHDNRIAAITDEIARIDAVGFDLWLEIDTEGDDQPSLKDTRRTVKSWLDGLDWRRERAKWESDGVAAELPELRHETGHWKFCFRAIPRAPEHRDVLRSALGVGPSGSGIFDHSVGLSNGIAKKAAQCKQHDVPTIIAVRADGLCARDDDIRIALMGRTIGRLAAGDPTSVIDTGHHTSGVFRDADGTWRNRHVFGVLVWDAELQPWSITRQTPTLWLHPNPSGNISELSWRRRPLVGSTDDVIAGTFDPGRTFDLPDQDQFDDPKRWPGQPFARQH